MKDKLSKIFIEFTQSEKNASLLLLACTVISLILANTHFVTNYTSLWHHNITISFLNFQLSYPLEQWINDGLMSIFFLLVGLEIERELYEGELHPIKNAIVPVVAAVGGMLMPALIYLFINQHSPEYYRGFGIPMATDIAFSLAILALIKHKVPHSMKILLTALAIIDDLGSIVVIALFYGKEIQWIYLIFSIGIFLVMIAMNKLKVYRLTPYLLLAIPMWYTMMKSGIHATVSGVLLAFALPFNSKQTPNPSIKMQEILHIPVGFIILPLFILCNTAIPLHVEYIDRLIDKHAIGIAAGLVLGKPIGIFLSVYLLSQFKIVSFSSRVGWIKVLGIGFAAGIGFTMSIFITYLAFYEEALIQSSKMMILIASSVSALLAYFVFAISQDEK